jgi:hypothetical protein
MFDPIRVGRRSSPTASSALVPSTPLRPSWLGAIAIVPLLIGSLGVLAGCNGDHLLRPESAPVELVEPAPGAVIELSLVLDEGENAPARELGLLTRPADVATALGALPPADREALLTHGSCITRDAAFRAVVRELLGLGTDVRGVAGHIDDSSWGRIKAHFHI